MLLYVFATHKGHALSCETQSIITQLLVQPHREHVQPAEDVWRLSVVGTGSL